jgi:hypothetical protein
MLLNSLISFQLPGVNVRITIFGDFCPIFCEKIGAFLENQCDEQNVAKISSIFNKNAEFLASFLQNYYFSNHNIDPRSRKDHTHRERVTIETRSSIFSMILSKFC